MASIRIVGNDIRDKSNKKLGAISGDTIRDANNRTIARIVGTDIRDSSNRKLASLAGDDIRDPSNLRIARLSQVKNDIDGFGGITLAAVWPLFVSRPQREAGVC